MRGPHALAGAALAGRSLENATMGVHHGLAQLVGGRTGIAHGLANAVILPHAMRFNADVAPDEMQRIGEALGDPDDAPSAVARLIERLGLPTRLRDCDVDEDDLDAVARHVAVVVRGSSEPPPRRRGRRPGDPRRRLLTRTLARDWALGASCRVQLPNPGAPERRAAPPVAYPSARSQWGRY